MLYPVAGYNRHLAFFLSIFDLVAAAEIDVRPPAAREMALESTQDEDTAYATARDGAATHSSW
jgi:hypothetical protein